MFIEIIVFIVMLKKEKKDILFRTLLGNASEINKNKIKENNEQIQQKV